MSSDTAFDNTAVLTPPRIFRYNGQTIIDKDQDPGPEFTPQMILDHIKTTGIYPELSSAKIEIRQSTLADGTVQIEFVKSGTKGIRWPDWISVEDGLPTNGDLVLVVTSEMDEVTIGSWAEPVEGLDETDWVYLDYMEWVDGKGKITHWMPFPPLPPVPEAPEFDYSQHPEQSKTGVIFGLGSHS